MSRVNTGGVWVDEGPRRPDPLSDPIGYAVEGMTGDYLVQHPEVVYADKLVLLRGILKREGRPGAQPA